MSKAARPRNGRRLVRSLTVLGEVGQGPRRPRRSPRGLAGRGLARASSRGGASGGSGDEPARMDAATPSAAQRAPQAVSVAVELGKRRRLLAPASAVRADRGRARRCLALRSGLRSTRFREASSSFTRRARSSTASSLPGARVRIGGLVKEGSVTRSGDRIAFVITDTAKEVKVSYQGIVPDLFREGQGVVAEGVLRADLSLERRQCAGEA